MRRTASPTIDHRGPRTLVWLLSAVLLAAACGPGSGSATDTAPPTPGQSAAAGASLGTVPTDGPVAGSETTPGPTDGPQAPQPDPTTAAGQPAQTEPPAPTGAPAPTTAPVPATPSPSPSPAPSPLVLDPAPKAGKFKLDLYYPRAFVAQYTADWCVPAAMQMIANMTDRTRLDRTRETQRQLYIRAREISPWTESGPGASIVGWMGALEERGFGRFQELADPDYDTALKVLARQMRFTNRPAGLWVWDGDHAWVVSGFTSTADPAWTDDFRVTGIWVEDPWSGRVSRTWGAGRKPHTLLSPKQLRRAWTPFSSIHRPQYGEAGMFVVIAPVV